MERSQEKGRRPIDRLFKCLVVFQYAHSPLSSESAWVTTISNVPCGAPRLCNTYVIPFFRVLKPLIPKKKRMQRKGGCKHSHHHPSHWSNEPACQHFAHENAAASGPCVVNPTDGLATCLPSEIGRRCWQLRSRHRSSSRCLLERKPLRFSLP